VCVYIYIYCPYIYEWILIRIVYMMSCGEPLDRLGPEWRGSAVGACAGAVGGGEKRKGMCAVRTSAGKGSSESCSEARREVYCSGKRSTRVEMTWPVLT